MADNVDVIPMPSTTHSSSLVSHVPHIIITFNNDGDNEDDDDEGDDSGGNNNNFIEKSQSSLRPPIPPPPPPTRQQTIESLPLTSGVKIDSYKPNGVHLGALDNPLPPPYHYYSKLDGRCQQRAAHNRTDNSTVSTTNTYTTNKNSISAKATGISRLIESGKAPRYPTRQIDEAWGRFEKRPVISQRTAGKNCGDSLFVSDKKTRILFKTKPHSASSLRDSVDFTKSVAGNVNDLNFGCNNDSINEPSKFKHVDTNDVIASQKLLVELCNDAHGSNKHWRFNTKRYLETKIRAMYSQRRLNVPSSARGHSDRPRNSIGHRPHSSRAGSTSIQGLEDNGSDKSEHSLGIGLLSKFRLVARMTIILIRLMKAIIENSNDLTTRSAAELQWLTVYGRDTESTMAFNKNLYSRDRVMTHIPEWAMSILQLEPECRTELHCRRLHALLRGLKSFDKFTDEIQMSLCRAFRLEIVTEGRILLKHGHIGVYFYFIYSGSVFVNTQDKGPDGRPFMRTITVLTRGQSFGELALLQDIKRTATVSVREKCELLVVDKEVFARVCPQIFEKELEEKRNFLSGMSLFPQKWWGPEDMRALSMEAQIQEFKINKVIVPDSSLEDWIYTCVEGKCQVIHCISLLSKTSDSTDQKRKTSDIVLSEEIIDLLSSATGWETPNTIRFTAFHLYFQQALWIRIPISYRRLRSKHRCKIKIRTTTVTKTNEQEVDADIKEKLLSSLGLDYVASGKRRHAYVKDDIEKERLRAIQGLDDATTLTALMKKREETRKGLVYLNVGFIEPGEVFDLHSLVRDDRDTSNQTSCLMLVSSGAKILKVRKAAFFEHASDQALEHTRTLASKQRFLSDQSLIESYRQKKKWERYKSQVVNSVVTTRRPSTGIGERQDTPCSSRVQTPRPKSQRFSRSARTSRSDTPASSSKPCQNGVDHDNDNYTTDLLINVMQKENQAPLETELPDLKSAPDSLHRLNADHNNLSTVQNGLESNWRSDEDEMLERPASLVPSFDTNATIIRRNPVRAATPRGRVLRSVTSRPRTVHTRFSTR